MIVVADSGSTKTTWAVVGSESYTTTEGLNPHFCTDQQFRQTATGVIEALGTPSQVFFYGAGCGNSKQRQRVEHLLRDAFGTQNIFVGTDMLGACRATCGNRPGVVSILGTGSNSCYYNGTEIDFQLPSTGYIIGDHGSGNHIGRLLLHDYLTAQMPPEIATLVAEQYPLSHDQFIDAIYHQPHANRMLASLAPIATTHIAHPYCRALLHHCITEWRTKQLAPVLQHTTCRNLHIVGSLGAALEPLLRQSLQAHEPIRLDFMPAPIVGLLAYHAQQA